MWSIEDVAARDIAYWLAPGGTDNGVWADTWVVIADLDAADATDVLDLLAQADVGGYVAIPGGRRARARGPVAHSLYVDMKQYGRAVDVLVAFMQDRCATRAPHRSGARRSRGMPR